MSGSGKADIQFNSDLVAIVVPTYKQHLTSDEKISLNHLTHFLGDYPKYLLAPKSLKVNYQGFQFKRFDDKFFQSTATYSDLMLSKRFYEAFSKYKYVLIFQLDALVFSDQLVQWCQTDLDYIGAPWLRGSKVNHVEIPTVGNGGFSLRKVESFLKVLNSSVTGVGSNVHWEAFRANRPAFGRLLELPRKIAKQFKMFNGVGWETLTYRLNEDVFWSLEASKYYPEFKIASVSDGFRFAFEVFPRRCFALNNHTLPFGCHAWAKYDRSFWEPYLLK